MASDKSKVEPTLGASTQLDPKEIVKTKYDKKKELPEIFLSNQIKQTTKKTLLFASSTRMLGATNPVKSVNSPPQDMSKI